MKWVLCDIDLLGETGHVVGYIRRDHATGEWSGALMRTHHDDVSFPTRREAQQWVIQKLVEEKLDEPQHD